METYIRKAIGYGFLLVALAAFTVTLINVTGSADSFEDWLAVTKALLSWQTATAAIVGLVAPQAALWIARR